MLHTLFYIFLIINQINSLNIDNLAPLEEDSSKTITIGMSQAYSVEYNKDTKFTFNIKEDGISLINIHSINCNFNIDSNGEIINQINLDTYSLKMNRTNNSLVIQPLMNEMDGEEEENYAQKKCHLSINSFYVDQTEVKIENKEDSFFYFKDYDKLKISYEINKIDNESFAALYFRFNENSNFSVRVTYNNEAKEKELISKNIYNSTYIFLNSDILKNANINEQNINLNIVIKKNDNKEINMFFKIIEKETISMLQKNALNYGFITTQTTYQYFYLEAFKEEEGELMLHNKRFYGELIAKIVTKDEINTNINDSSIYPEKKLNNTNSTFINYNPHSLKLIYTYEDTLNCDNGCYILITYKQKQSEGNYPNIGYEFTLLSRSWNFSDYNPQIIDIPFNEFILGAFETDSINTYHYYSIVILKETEKIIIQIEGNYIDCFVGEGRKIINTKILRENVMNLNIINKMNVINLNVTEKFKDRIISFAFRSKDYFDNIFSFYYFRILYVPKDEIIYFPIDSQLGNLCLPEKNAETNSYFCHLKFTNQYNELSTNFSASTFNQNEYTKIYIKKVLKNGTVIEEVNEMFYIYYNDTTDIDYFLFAFEFQNLETKSIISSLHEKIKYFYPQIYSSQMFYNIEFNKTCLFTVTKNYTLINNYIYGLYDIYGGLIDISFSNYHYFPSTRNQRGIPFTIDIDSKTNNIEYSSSLEWLFVLKLEYNMRNKGIIEIKSGETISHVMESGYFPLYYYLKIKDENFINIDVNLKLNNLEDDYIKNNIEIKGYLLNEDTIKRKNNGEYILLENPINGTYSEQFRGGLLEVNQNKTNNSDYLLIEIENKDTSHINSHIFLELITKEYYEEVYFMPINQFIIETFDNNNDTIRDNNKYHICANLKGDEQVIIEISPEFNDIELVFTNETNNNSIKCSDFDCTVQNMGGFKKYIINNIVNENIYFDIVNPKKRRANYMIRYYYADEDFEHSYRLNNNIGKDYINQNNVTIDLSTTFDPIQFLINNEPYYPYDTHYFYISGILYKKNDTDELLNTSSLLHERTPFREDQTINTYYWKESEKFTLVFKDIPRTDNFVYDLQIKIIVYVENSIFIKELLTFTAEVDLTDIKLEPEVESSVWIIIGPIIGVVFLLIVAFFLIKYIRLKKANVNLKEDLKSISYSNDIQKNVLNKERQYSERQNDYDKDFI